ncbi:MAG: DUF1592 domain-containing protein [Chthoniobacteraceae bacterium]
MKLLPVLSILALSTGAALAASEVPPPMHAFVEKFCIDCHDGDSKKGGLNLDGLAFAADPAVHTRWVQVFDKVLSGEMPPAKKPRADEATKRAFLTTLGGGLLQQHTAMKGTVLRRLNRTEYENTLCDLLGFRVEVRDLLPEDSLSHGFDNIGEALSMSDVQLARYLEAVEFALNTVLQHAKQPEAKKVTHDYKQAAEKAKSWLLRDDGAVVIFNNGGFPDTTLRAFRAPTDGKYRVSIAGYAYQAKRPVVFALHSGRFAFGGSSDFLGYHEIAPDKPQTITVEAWLREGETLKISPVLAQDYQQMQKLGPAQYPGTGLAVKGVEIEGPLYDQWPPRGAALLFGDLLKNVEESTGGARPKGGAKRASAPNQKPIIEVKSSNPEADAKRLLRGFASAAFRRPVDEAKIAPYLALFQDELKKSESFSIAMRTAAVAIFCAPDFLYLREPAGKLDDYALAARLSYFLWRTTPDDELLRTAAAGKLREPATLRTQTERLLGHTNAARFTANFTDAWLNLRDIEFTTPDKKLYPEFDEQLQDAMVRESRAYFDELLRANLPPASIVTSDFAMLNERLAEHYGIPGVEGTAMRKVKLAPDSRRGGVLTQGAVLKVSANGTNTSPIVRGAWVLERILGTPPPPPPPGVPGVEPDIRGATTLREQLEKHRNVESCNGCHRVIDPPGFALENYDVIGGWREKFRTLEKGAPTSLQVNGRKVNIRLGPPVDATGQLTDGTKFSDFASFQKLLLARPEIVTKAITEKLLTFGSGRELGFSDRTEVARIVSELLAKKGGMRDLIHAVVGSQIFQSE